MNHPTPFACIPVSVARDANLTPQARCLYIVLATYANSEGICWPSWERLSNDLGLSVRTIGRLLSQLEEAYLLKREHHKGKRTIYQLTTLRYQTGGADEGDQHSASPDVESQVGHDSNDTPVMNDTETSAPDVMPVAEDRATSDTGVTEVCHPCHPPPDTDVSQPLSSASERTIYKNYNHELYSRTQAEMYDPSHGWPEVWDVLQYAAMSNIPTEEAKSIWESYTAVGWVDKHGKPIRHWGAALQSAWRYRQTSSKKRYEKEQTNTRHYQNSSRETRIAETLAYMRLQEQQEEEVH